MARKIYGYTEYLKEKESNNPKQFDKGLLVMKIGLVIAVLVLLIPAFFYWNKTQIRKDCFSAIKMYNEYNVQPENSLVKECHYQGIEMKP